jgi:beta-galactosidase
VYTSYDSAELFVNGKSMGVQKKHRNGTPQNRYRLMWMDVKYEPGTVKVVAYDKDGKPAAEKEIKTAGKPDRIILEPDRTTISADGEDISFVTVSVVDKNGNPCPTINEQLRFSVKGKGVYRAACNGDATSLEPFHLPTMKLFNGKLVVLVQSTKEAGDVELSVHGRGLKTGKVLIQTKK